VTGSKLTHIDQGGAARMVDVSEKAATERVAVAEGRVRMSKATLDLVLSGNAKKGDVLGAARIAGIMAAKKTHDLIPLCHPLAITKVEIDIAPDDAAPGGAPGLVVRATVKVTGHWTESSHNGSASSPMAYLRGDISVEMSTSVPFTVHPIDSFVVFCRGDGAGEITQQS